MNDNDEGPSGGCRTCGASTDPGFTRCDRCANDELAAFLGVESPEADRAVAAPLPPAPPIPAAPAVPATVGGSLDLTQEVRESAGRSLHQGNQTGPVAEIDQEPEQDPASPTEEGPEQDPVAKIDQEPEQASAADADLVAEPDLSATADLEDDRNQDRPTGLHRTSKPPRGATRHREAAAAGGSIESATPADTPLAAIIAETLARAGDQAAGSEGDSAPTDGEGSSADRATSFTVPASWLEDTPAWYEREDTQADTSVPAHRSTDHGRGPPAATRSSDRRRRRAGVLLGAGVLALLAGLSFLAAGGSSERPALLDSEPLEVSDRPGRGDATTTAPAPPTTALAPPTTAPAPPTTAPAPVPPPAPADPSPPPPAPEAGGGTPAPAPAPPPDPAPAPVPSPAPPPGGGGGGGTQDPEPEDRPPGGGRPDGPPGQNPSGPPGQAPGGPPGQR